MAGTEKFCKVKLNNIGGNSTVPYSQLLDLRSVQTLNERASSESTASFLKGLPSYNENNFTRFQPDATCKSSMKKSSVYVPTKEHPTDQIITTEKTTILLRYLQQQCDKKLHDVRVQMKRDAEKGGPSGVVDVTPRKKSRLASDD